MVRESRNVDWQQERFEPGQAGMKAALALRVGTAGGDDGEVTCVLLCPPVEGLERSGSGVLKGSERTANDIDGDAGRREPGQIVEEEDEVAEGGDGWQRIRVRVGMGLGPDENGPVRQRAGERLEGNAGLAGPRPGPAVNSQRLTATAP